MTKLIEILFQNSEFIALNKPEGLSVHNVEDGENLLLLMEREFSQKLFPVHRLDKETSGVQLLARSEGSAKTLSEAFQEKSVIKTYRGVMRGQLESTIGSWKKPLTDRGEGRNNPSGSSANRVPCETEFKVLQSSKYFTMAEFNLITGRQHQIRKHAALARHELVGDGRYGDPKYNKRISGIYNCHRLFLHCSKIEILGIVIESPIPEAFNSLFNNV